MKRREFIKLSAVLAAGGVLAGCGAGSETGTAGAQTLRVCTEARILKDGAGLAAKFNARYPQITLQFETLPTVGVAVENGTATVDSDELAQRTALLQKHRTALMAGSTDCDVYVLYGGATWQSELNGGALVQDYGSLLRSGVLADLSGLFEGADALDRADYVPALMEAGVQNGELLVVPLKYSLPGLIVNRTGACGFAPVDGADLYAFAEALLDASTQQLAYLNRLATLPLYALSQPPVDKRSGTLPLAEDTYGRAMALVERLQSRASAVPADQGDYAARVQRGDWFMLRASMPVLYAASIGSALEAAGVEAHDLRFIPVPNERGGLTAMPELCAFVPTGSKQKGAALAFLRWLLQAEIQTAGLNDEVGRVFADNCQLPVLRGCVEKQLANTLYATADAELSPAWQAYAASVTAQEERITAVRFGSSYDDALNTAVQRWAENGGNLTADYLQPLIDEWTLYLDE